jgi:hypothetical protein
MSRAARLVLLFSLLARPALADGSVWSKVVNAFTPEGLVFFRPEMTYGGTDLDANARQTAFLFTLRGDVGLRIDLPRHVGGLVTLQGYGVYTQDAGPLDATMRLFEAYLEMTQIGGTPLAIRAGRQQLGPFGNQLLIGNKDFENGFSFEAIRVRWAGRRVDANLVWAQLYQEKLGLNPAQSTWLHPVFFGSYNTVRIINQVALEAYFIALISKPVGIFTTHTLTAGARLFGAANGFDYSAELAWQFGPASTDDGSRTAVINAYALEASAGYTLGRWRRRPRFGLSYYRASGDGNPNDGTLHSFNIIWQNDHGRFGNLDLLKGSNLQVARALLSVPVVPDALTVGASVVYAGVLEPTDPSTGLFPAGTMLPQTAGHDIGAGGDLFLVYAYSNELAITTNVSLLGPLDYVRDVTGRTAPLVRVYVHMQLTF